MFVINSKSRIIDLAISAAIAPDALARGKCKAPARIEPRRIGQYVEGEPEPATPQFPESKKRCNQLGWLAGFLRLVGLGYLRTAFSVTTQPRYQPNISLVCE